MGLSLLSDTLGDYPLEERAWQADGHGRELPVERRWEEYIKRVKAKPFSRDFLEQMDAAQRLYGDYLRFGMSCYGIHHFMDRMREKYGVGDEGLYGKEEWRRVEWILSWQAHSYAYMFES